MLLIALVLLLAYGLVRHVTRYRLPAPPAYGDYLTRWTLLRFPWRRYFLHRVYQADPGRDVHNHPWPDAGTFVLWGGYVELIVWRGSSGQWRERWHTVKRWTLSREAFAPNTYHTIVSVQPNTWTLFFAGQRLRDWGFLEAGVHVPHEPYLKARGLLRR